MDNLESIAGDESPEQRDQSGETPPREGSSSLMAAAALLGALAGIALGAAGLYYGTSSMKQISALRESETVSPEDLAALQKDVSQIRDKLGQMDKQSNLFGRQLREVKSKTQSGFENMSKAVESTRAVVAELQQKMSQPAVKEAARPAAPASDYHTVRSGDTFEKLARQYDTTVEAFLTANPGANPRRLQIGQRVKIPSAPAP